MKIRLDENISYRVANAIKAIVANRKGFEVSWALDNHKPATSDPAWISKFAAHDGIAVISGDADILQHWPDLIAYTESGLISFFPPRPFSRMNGFGQAAFVLQWFPAIVEKIKISNRGDRWRMPLAWSGDHTSMESLKDPRIDTDEKKKGLGIEPTAKVHPIRAGAGSG